MNSSVFKLLRLLSYYLNVTDPLIIPWIFIFLSCEKAHEIQNLQEKNNDNIYIYIYIYI